MRRRLAALCFGAVVLAVAVMAQDFVVNVAPLIDPSAFRTFAIRSGRVESARPEFDNPLLVKKLSSSIRAALTSRGLTETSDRPDLVVDYVLATEDINTISSEPPRGPLRLMKVSLVIDLMAGGTAAPVWRGVYRDEQKIGSRLVEKLPEAARELAAKFPRRGA